MVVEVEGRCLMMSKSPWALIPFITFLIIAGMAVTAHASDEVRLAPKGTHSAALERRTLHEGLDSKIVQETDLSLIAINSDAPAAWTPMESGGWHASQGRAETSRMVGDPILLPELSKTDARLILRLNEKYDLETDRDFGLIELSLDHGETWFVTDVRTGRMDWNVTDIDLTTYAGQTVLIAYTMDCDENIAFDGWSLRESQLTVVKRDEAFDISLVDLDHRRFPLVAMNVSVRSLGEPYLDLNDSDFRVFEDGAPQWDYFDVAPPDQSGGNRLADIVFILDVSGSMSQGLTSVKNNMLSFITALESSDIDYRIGFLTFSDRFAIYNGGNLYSDHQEIINIVNSISTSGHDLGPGNRPGENQLESMAATATQMVFRPGSPHIGIMLTDEPSLTSPYSVAQCTATLLASGLQIYPIFNTNDISQNTQYIPIAEATNASASYYHIYDNFNDIITNIQDTISDTYVVQYRSDNATIDGLARTVRLEAELAGETRFLETTYIPGSAPRITRTQETIDLSSQNWLEGSTFGFTVYVDDDMEPGVQHAWLHYKTVSVSQIYDPVEMTQIGSNIYWVELSGLSVTQPGIWYYITATDGLSTVSDPTVNPNQNPYFINVLPNVAPLILHVPPSVTDVDPGEPLTISAYVTDTTYELTEVLLHYRAAGQLTGYEPVVMNNTFGGNQYNGLIPADVVTLQGFDYYLEAHDDVGSSTLHGTADDPHEIHPWLDPNAGVNITLSIQEESGSHRVKQVELTYSNSYKKDEKNEQKSLMRRDVEYGAALFDEAATNTLLGIYGIFNARLLDATGNLIGQIPLRIPGQTPGDFESFQAILIVHDEKTIRETHSGYTEAIANGWEHSDEYLNEYFVSMLIPPGDLISNADPANREANLLVHGIYGEYPYWGTTDECIPYQTGYGDNWSFYYPNDIFIADAADMLGKAVRMFFEPTGVAGVGRYVSGDLRLVAHSMGGLVCRSYIQNQNHSVSRLLMYATPNHGSLASYRMRYMPGWTEQLADNFAGKDKDSPAHRDMSPGSRFLQDLNGTAPKNLKFNIPAKDYLVVAGTRHHLPGGTLDNQHREIEYQDDAVVSVSSANLLDFGIPLALVHEWHNDLHKTEIHSGTTAEAFLSSQYQPVGGSHGLGSWVQCFMVNRDSDLCEAGHHQRPDGSTSDQYFDPSGGIMMMTVANSPWPGYQVFDFGHTGTALVFYQEDHVQFPVHESYMVVNPETWGQTRYMCFSPAENTFAFDAPGQYGLTLRQRTDPGYSVRFVREVVGHSGPYTDEVPLSSASDTHIQFRSLGQEDAWFEYSQLGLVLASASGGILLEPDVKSATHQFTVDSGMTEILLKLHLSDEEVWSRQQITVTTPGGSTFSPGDVAGIPGIEYEDHSVEQYGLIGITNPEPGMWSIEYEGDANIIVTAYYHSSVTISMTAVGETYLRGDPVELELQVPQNINLVTMETSLFSTRDQGQTTQFIGLVEMSLEGAGVFKGAVIPNRTGMYSLQTHITYENDQGETAKRAVLTSFTIGGPNYNEVTTPDEQVACYPTPFNPDTDPLTIQITVVQQTDFRMTIRDVSGSVVISRQLDPLEIGIHEFLWDGRDSRGEVVANGVYFITFSSDNQEHMVGKTAVIR
jgi:pimeloyl-ACP methyl ester carboxylesterase